MPEIDSRYTTDGVTIELVEDVPEHISFRDDSTTLCGASPSPDADTRVISADENPLAESSLHLCHECAEEWSDSEDDIERAPTIWCACDRVEEGVIYKCGKVVAAEDARVLNHPSANGHRLAVCPDCYEWIRNRPHNDVNAPYEEAPSWASVYPEVLLD